MNTEAEMIAEHERQRRQRQYESARERGWLRKGYEQQRRLLVSRESDMPANEFRQRDVELAEAYRSGSREIEEELNRDLAKMRAEQARELDELRKALS